MIEEHLYELLETFESKDASYEAYEDCDAKDVLSIVKKIGGCRVACNASDIKYVKIELVARKIIERACFCLNVDLEVQRLK